MLDFEEDPLGVMAADELGQETHGNRRALLIILVVLTAVLGSWTWVSEPVAKWRAQNLPGWMSTEKEKEALASEMKSRHMFEILNSMVAGSSSKSGQ